MIDPRSTRAYKLEKENRELKKEIELLRNGNDITKIINDNVVFLKYQKEQQQEIERLNNIIKHTDSWIDRTIEIIKQQPSEDDTWILERLNGIKQCLKGVDKE